MSDKSLDRAQTVRRAIILGRRYVSPDAVFKEFTEAEKALTALMAEIFDLEEKCTETYHLGFKDAVLAVAALVEPDSEHLTPSEPGQGSRISRASSGDERNSPARTSDPGESGSASAVADDPAREELWEALRTLAEPPPEPFHQVMWKLEDFVRWDEWNARRIKALKLAQSCP